MIKYFNLMIYIFLIYIFYLFIYDYNCSKESFNNIEHYTPYDAIQFGDDIKNLTAVVTTAENSNTDTIYKGFTFEIVDKYFSPTLNQKIGQARNKQGIVLLQTEPSFTQDPKVLIEELKLIIDRDNLKAD